MTRDRQGIFAIWTLKNYHAHINAPTGVPAVALFVRELVTVIANGRLRLNEARGNASSDESSHPTRQPLSSFRSPAFYHRGIDPVRHPFGTTTSSLLFVWQTLGYSFDVRKVTYAQYVKVVSAHPKMNTSSP